MHNLGHKLSTAIESGNNWSMDVWTEMSRVYHELLLSHLDQMTRITDYEFNKVRKKFKNIGLKIVLDKVCDSIYLVNDLDNNYLMINNAHLSKFKNTSALKLTLLELYEDLKMVIERRYRDRDLYCEVVDNFQKFLSDKLGKNFKYNPPYDYDKCEISYTAYWCQPIDYFDMFNSLKDYNLEDVRFEIKIKQVNADNTIDYEFNYRINIISHRYE